MKVTLKNAIKQFLLRSIPGPTNTLQRIWQRNHIRQFERRLGLPHIARAFVERYGLKVLSGPFQGMTYIPQAVGSVLMPKLLGCYEAELHSVLDRILKTEYTVIIDIGCAEGYYAVGLALRLPTARVYGFDTDPLGRKLCAAMVQANNVSDRLTITGKCEFEQLNTLLIGRSLIVCDCEGCELDLLCPDLVPGMSSADILVELHDRVNPSISRTIVARFNTTHDIVLITSIERDPSLHPVLDFIDHKDRHLAVCEFRSGGGQWAFMTPKHILWANNHNESCYYHAAS